jgi:hypothetical protein
MQTELSLSPCLPLHIGVPSLLWGMASQEDVVATLVLLHHKLLRAAASDLKPTGTLQLEYLGELMVAPYFAETW